MNDFESMKKEIRTNRVIMIILLIMMTAFLVCLSFAFVYARSIMIRFSALSELVSRINPQDISDLISTFNSLGNLDLSFLQNLDFSVLESIDFEALESIDFEGISKVLSNIDVDELTKTMENLNNASEMLEEVSEKVAPILSLFGK